MLLLAGRHLILDSSWNDCNFDWINRFRNVTTRPSVAGSVAGPDVTVGGGESGAIRGQQRAVAPSPPSQRWQHWQPLHDGPWRTDAHSDHSEQSGADGRLFRLAGPSGYRFDAAPIGGHRRSAKSQKCRRVRYDDDGQSHELRTEVIIFIWII